MNKDLRSLLLSKLTHYERTFLLGDTLEVDKIEWDALGQYGTVCIASRVSEQVTDVSEIHFVLGACRGGNLNMLKWIEDKHSSVYPILQFMYGEVIREVVTHDHVHAFAWFVEVHDVKIQWFDQFIYEHIGVGILRFILDNRHKLLPRHLAVENPELRELFHDCLGWELQAAERVFRMMSDECGVEFKLLDAPVLLARGNHLKMLQMLHRVGFNMQWDQMERVAQHDDVREWIRTQQKEI